jgi:hypothetical protein
MVAATSTPSVGAGTIARTDTAPSVHFSSASDSLCGEFAENGLLIPDTRRSAVAAQIGRRPDSTRSQPTPNPHTTGQTDSVVYVFYPGLTLHYIVLGKATGERDMLLAADVSDNRFLKYPSVGVGANAETIVSTFGEPEEQASNMLTYTCAMHIMSGSTVHFYLENDRVEHVEYTFYVD